MPRLAICSDTHIPSRADEIPAWVEEELRAADHVIHAGDFDSVEALETVEALVAGEFTAVHGNVDPAEVDLPTTTSVTVGDQEFVVTHGSGPLEGYRDRVVERVREAAETPDAVAVAGHSHEALDTVHEGVRLLNPGSATGAEPAAETSMMRVSVDDGVTAEILRG